MLKWPYDRDSKSPCGLCWKSTGDLRGKSKDDLADLYCDTSHYFEKFPVDVSAQSKGIFSDCQHWQSTVTFCWKSSIDVCGKFLLRNVELMLEFSRCFGVKINLKQGLFRAMWLQKTSWIFVLRHIELMLKFTRCFGVNIKEGGFLIYTCVLTLSYVSPHSFIYVRHQDSFIYMTLLIHMCDMDGSRGKHATHRADVEIHALLRSQDHSSQHHRGITHSFMCDIRTHSSQHHRGIFLLGVRSQLHLKPPSQTHTYIQNISGYM